MTLRELTIGPRDVQWHAAFLRYIARVFPEISFARWIELGGWDEGYTCFALAEGDEIVANVSTSSMCAIIASGPCRAVQLGAVGTVPEARNRGLSRRVMERALATIDAAGEPAYLFANESVLGFYPKFGFRRVVEHVFGMAVEIAPSDPLPTLSLERAADIALLREIAASALPVTKHFGARDYGSTVLWYWTNFRDYNLYYSAAERTIIVAEQERDVLRVHDVISPAHVAVAPLLARLVRAPVRTIELGFGSDVHLPGAEPLRPYEESTLFVRGDLALPREPFKYPVLAQT